MTLRRLSTRLLLRPEDVPPRATTSRSSASSTPARSGSADEVVLLVRVAERPREQRPGFTGLPRWEPDGGLTVDWVPDDAARADRSAGRPAQGRRAGAAHLHLAPAGRPLRRRPIGPGSDRRHVPPASRSWRSSASRTRGSRRSTAGSTSPTSPSRGTARRRPWRRRPTSARSSGTGVIFCSENKDVVLFPERSPGDLRGAAPADPATPFCRPEMWIAGRRTCIHWGHHGVLARRRRPSGRPAASAQGRRRSASPDGWLEIYHGNRHPTRPGEVGAYSTGRSSSTRTTRPGSSGGPRSRSSSPTADFERTASCPTSSSRPVSSRRRVDPRLLRRGRYLHGGRGVLGAGAAGRDDRPGMSRSGPCRKPDRSILRRIGFVRGARPGGPHWLALKIGGHTAAIMQSGPRPFSWDRATLRGHDDSFGKWTPRPEQRRFSELNTS